MELQQIEIAACTTQPKSCWYPLTCSLTRSRLATKIEKKLKNKGQEKRVLSRCDYNHLCMMMSAGSCLFFSIRPVFSEAGWKGGASPQP